jgi:hypothetical protein
MDPQPSRVYAAHLAGQDLPTARRFRRGCGEVLLDERACGPVNPRNLASPVTAPGGARRAGLIIGGLLMTEIGDQGDEPNPESA